MRLRAFSKSSFMGKRVAGAWVGVSFLTPGLCIFFRVALIALLSGRREAQAAVRKLFYYAGKMQRAFSMILIIRLSVAACCFATRIAKLSGPPMILPVFPSFPMYLVVSSYRRVAQTMVTVCHSEPFDFSQDKLREESVSESARCSIKNEILRRFAPQNDSSYNAIIDQNSLRLRL